MTDRRRAIRTVGSAGLAAWVLASCKLEAPEFYRVQEAVLHPGETVSCTNNFGTIRISYVSETERKFEFDGRTVVKKLIVRTDRWMGKMGLYDPASAGSIFSNPEYRLLFDESELRFRTYNEAYEYLYTQWEYSDWVYTTDGLICGYHVEEPKESGQFPVYSVELYQDYVGGAKPTGLLSDRNGSVRIERTRPD